MIPGEVKRIPRSQLHPVVGFYVACPACGIITAITADEQTFTEDVVDGELAVTMKPGYACNRKSCGKVFAYDRDEIKVSDGV